jgi:hypothetical protein
MPDLDWSQVRETVLMLELAVGQIEAAMKEGSSSVEVLTDSFTSMAGYMRMMGSALEQLPDTPATAQLKESLIGHAGEVAGRVQKSIIAFQFYDKLSQRLAHVSHSLEALTNAGDRPAQALQPLRVGRPAGEDPRQVLDSRRAGDVQRGDAGHAGEGCPEQLQGRDEGQGRRTSNCSDRPGQVSRLT